MLKSQDFRHCKLNELKALKKKHEAFESDLAAHQVIVSLLCCIVGSMWEKSYGRGTEAYWDVSVSSIFEATVKKTARNKTTLNESS